MICLLDVSLHEDPRVLLVPVRCFARGIETTTVAAAGLLSTATGTGPSTVARGRLRRHLSCSRGVRRGCWLMSQQICNAVVTTYLCIDICTHRMLVGRELLRSGNRINDRRRCRLSCDHKCDRILEGGPMKFIGRCLCCLRVVLRQPATLNKLQSGRSRRTCRPISEIRY